MPLSSCGLREQLFLHEVLHEVHRLQEDGDKRVLIFPPQIAPRFRFLLHQSIGQHYSSLYKTISVGSQNQRRTFLYNMSLVQSPDNDNELHEVTHASEASEPVSGRVKRPNKPLYQPPQATSSRRKSSPPNAATSTTTTTAGSEAGTESEEGTWDSLYDEAGECIDPDLISEFKSALRLNEEEDLKFERTTGDYSGFTVSDTQFDLTDNEYAHVLEVFGFADNLKTTDIFARIAGAGSSDFDIVWVDDTHALAVFGSQVAANAALHFTFPDLKVRVLSQATRESKNKAKNCTDRLLPFKKRPQTSLDAARRLVGRHLGLKVQVSKEQLQAEKKVLQEAKDRRRQIRKQTNDVWEGNVN